MVADQVRGELAKNPARRKVMIVAGANCGPIRELRAHPQVCFYDKERIDREGIPVVADWVVCLLFVGDVFSQTLFTKLQEPALKRNIFQRFKSDATPVAVVFLREVFPDWSPGEEVSPEEHAAAEEAATASPLDDLRDWISRTEKLLPSLKSLIREEASKEESRMRITELQGENEALQRELKEFRRKAQKVDQILALAREEN